MSYIRVIPRDLFNEANLLKCLGALYIALETAGPHTCVVEFEPEQEDADFDVQMSEATGAIWASNVTITVAGKNFSYYRPLNSRAAYPLYGSCFDEAEDEYGDPVRVFNEDGTLSTEFKQLIAK